MAESQSVKNDLTSFIQHNLNEHQRAAVEYPGGSLLVVAGAGSGKTRVITARIAHLLLNHNCSPAQILALTFTNKAAKEMRERIHSFLPAGSPIPFIGTFHAYCLQLLKQNTHLLDIPFSAILDADDQLSMIDAIIKRNNLQQIVSSRQIHYQISYTKNQYTIPEHSAQWSKVDPLLAQLYSAYEHEKTVNKCLDFDDLLLHSLTLFKKNSDFKKRFQSLVRHVLIDEYQDTNVVQHELLKQMTKDAQGLSIESLCAVGDEDQSIYSWRGATVSNIIHFNKDFPGTSTIKLEQNYRSVQQVLDVANTIIAHNTQRTSKKLWSSKKGTDRIRTLVCTSEYQEADAIATYLSTIEKAHKQHTRALLYRAHFQSRALEEALVKNALPYTIIGGIQFYERKEIKDLLAYLRLICNPSDRISFSRALNCPPRGLGEKFIELFQEQWHFDNSQPFSYIGQHLLDKQLITGIKALSLKKFLAMITIYTPDSSPLTALHHIIMETQYLAYLQKNNDPQEAKERTENVQELLRAVHYAESQGTKTISAFLDEVALMQEKLNAQNTNANPIILMTLHAAKGLEFDHVIIAGLEEGILPSSRSIASPEALEEERRLLYVGITRAQERLLLTYCRSRYSYGSLSTQRMSQFLEEIPTHLAPKHNLSSLSNYELRTFFSTWLGQLPPQSSSPVMTFKTTPPQSPLVKRTATITPSWRKNQLVQHETFGVGVIADIEERGSHGLVVTVKFKSSTKKIAAQFLKQLPS